jgi:hypothetical protein
MGPMTGRAAGYCAGYGTPGYMNPMPGRGWGGGFGRGWGRGFGRGGGGGFGWGAASPSPGYGYAPAYNPDPKEELEMLKQQADFFQQQMDGIKQRMDELSKEPEE